MNIRYATEKDTQNISELVIKAVTPYKHHDFNDMGWELFKKSNDFNTTKNRLTDNEYFTLCYVMDEKIVGIITMRQYKKVNQLYILPEATNIGIAKKLWYRAKEICIENGNEGAFWLWSSTMAVPVYKSFGFVHDGERFVRDGIVSYPMKFIINHG